MYSPAQYGLPALESPAQRVAREALLARISIGKAKAKTLMEEVARNVPRDRYVPIDKMFFSVPNGQDKLKITYRMPHGLDEIVDIHRFALGQLTQKTTQGEGETSSPSWTNLMRWLDQMSSDRWKRQLLAAMLNTMFGNQRFLNRRKQDAEFLHRLVNQELRGFLTQSYNRHMASMPQLRAFAEACQEMKAEPVGALVTDTKVGLQCCLPYAFEPVKGQFVGVGVWWGNSDFGDGKAKVAHTLVSTRSGSRSVMSEEWSRIHIGSVVTEGEIRLSDEVAAKEVEAACAAIKSAVETVLAPEAVKRLLEVIEKAAAEHISWLALQGQLKKWLKKDEIGKLGEALEQKIVDLPPPGVGDDGTPLPTRWWASNALGWLAEHEVDESRSSDLQKASGEMLGKVRE